MEINLKEALKELVSDDQPNKALVLQKVKAHLNHIDELLSAIDDSNEDFIHLLCALDVFENQFAEYRKGLKQWIVIV